LKALLDTSILVAAFLGDHVHHASSLELFVRGEKRETFCAAHSMAELYATLTRLPGKHRVSGENALLLLAQVRERLTPVTLNGSEYCAAIEQACAIGVTGGAVYDALIASCGLKAKAEILYTWNVRHFEQLGIVRRVQTP
jgi:predicted nucleic acid-binding protein